MNAECNNAAIAWAEYHRGNWHRAVKFAEYSLAENDECGSLWGGLRFVADANREF